MYINTYRNACSMLDSCISISLWILIRKYLNDCELIETATRELAVRNTLKSNSKQERDDRVTETPIKFKHCNLGQLDKKRDIGHPSPLEKCLRITDPQVSISNFSAQRNFAFSQFTS